MIKKPKIAFIEPLLAASMVIDRHLDSYIKEKTPYGLSHIKILLSIERAFINDKTKLCSQAAVAKLWGVSEAAISRQIILLEKERLITRNSDPNEKRRVILKLTAKGRRLLSKSSMLIDKELARIFKPLADTTKVQLQQHIQKVLEALSKNTNHYQITKTCDVK
jgi:DNA-binding MarR family transcriptional regulator